MLMSADSGYRYSLGFNYVSFASQRMFLPYVAILCLEERRLLI